MATRIEQLEATLAKQQAAMAATAIALETARMADLEAEETAKKLASAAEGLRGFLVAQDITIPAGKQVVITQKSTNGEMEYIVDVVDVAVKGKAKAAKGNGGGRIVLADGSTTSFAALCEAEGLEPGGDSAHRVFGRERPDMHAGIPHVCALDGKTYPLAG